MCKDIQCCDKGNHQQIVGMTTEHVFQKVYCWCCHNSEQNEQWNTFIEETEE